MKTIITLLLMVSIQITFMQKVMASVSLAKSDGQTMVINCETMVNCEMDKMINVASSMENCQNDCEMMSVVSAAHFIEYEHTLSFISTELSYPTLIIHPANSQPKSIYRPPLFS